MKRLRLLRLPKFCILVCFGGIVCLRMVLLFAAATQMNLWRYGTLSNSLADTKNPFTVIMDSLTLAPVHNTTASKIFPQLISMSNTELWHKYHPPNADKSEIPNTENPDTNTAYNITNQRNQSEIVNTFLLPENHTSDSLIQSQNISHDAVRVTPHIATKPIHKVSPTAGEKKKRRPLYYIMHYRRKDTTRFFHVKDLSQARCNRHGLHRPSLHSQNTFQDVDNKVVYVYSAYLDYRFPPDVYIRIIGIYKRVPGYKLLFWCHLWYGSDPHPHTVEANMWKEPHKKYGM